jgi:hypothetical protein
MEMGVSQIALQQNVANDDASVLVIGTQLKIERWILGKVWLEPLRSGGKNIQLLRQTL